MRQDLSPDELRVLEVLPGHPGWTADDVASQLGCSIFHAREVLQSLKDRGLVSRSVGAAGNMRNWSPLPARWSTITVEDQAEAA